jgi:PAS domain S-box-containing protein
MVLGDTYLALAEAVEEAVFVTEPQGRMLYANGALERLTGYTADDFQFPQTDNPFLHPDDAERVGRFIADFVESGASVSAAIENRFSDRWGQTRAYRSVLSRIAVDGKEAVQFVTRRADPGDPANPEPEMLRDYRAIVHNAGDGIVKLDRLGRFLFANGRFQQMVAHDAVALGRRTVADVVHPDDGAARFLAPGRFEARLVDARGEVVSVEVVVTALMPGEGVLAIVRDVTEQRRLEQQLARRQRLEGLGLLAGGIAHDFNNLLTVISVNATLSESSASRGGDSTSFLREIQRACGQAAKICQRLLTAAGRAQMARARLDLAALAVEVVDLLRTSVSPDSQISVEVAGPVQVDGDAGALQSLLMNLLTNAVDALGKRSGRVTVSVDVAECGADTLARLDSMGAVRPGQFARIRVKDTGTGIDEATRARMFDPFFTTKSAGHGLGLSSVLGTVRAHAGGIAIESTPGLGTSVTVLLPSAGHETEGSGSEVSPGKSPRTSRGEGRTVLVADDEDALRRSVSLILQDAGYRVILAKDGLEAIEAWRNQKDAIDVALLDAVMPHAGGVAAAIEIRNAPRSVPVVIMTGYTTEDIAGDGLTVLPKPFTAEALLALLDRVIASAGRA